MKNIFFLMILLNIQNIRGTQRVLLESDKGHLKEYVEFYYSWPYQDETIIRGMESLSPQAQEVFCEIKKRMAPFERKPERRFLKTRRLTLEGRKFYKALLEEL